jgi:hypothetical protein
MVTKLILKASYTTEPRVFLQTILLNFLLVVNLLL